MKIFISWSGPESNKVAIILKNWIESAIQSCSVYVSSENIDKGARWATDIASELEDSDFGILCVTNSNLESPWLQFEAGALSKSLEKSRVCPFLHLIKRSDIKGPLLQFQSTIEERGDIFKLVKTINAAAPETEKLGDDRIKQVFDVWFPELEKALGEVSEQSESGGVGVSASSATAESISEVRNSESGSPILEELLELARSQQRILNDPEELLPVSYFENYLIPSLVQETSGNVYVECDHAVWRDLDKASHAMMALLTDEEVAEKSPPQVIEFLNDLKYPLRFFHRQYLSDGKFTGCKSPSAKRTSRHLFR